MRPSVTRTAAGRAGAPVPSTRLALTMTNDSAVCAIACGFGGEMASAHKATATMKRPGVAWRGGPRRGTSADVEGVDKAGDLLKGGVKTLQRLVETRCFAIDSGGVPAA